MDPRSAAERVRLAAEPTMWSDWQPHSPFRTPWWRWGCACGIVADNLPVADWPDDAGVRRTVRFLAAADPSRDGHFWAAFEVYTGPSLRRDLVDAFLLTRLPPPTVAKRVGLPLAAIHAYTSIFGDAAERIDARDWVAANYFQERTGKQAAVGLVWKRMAYARGIEALDAAVAAAIRFGVPGCALGWPLPDPPEASVRTLAAARRALLASILSDEQAMELTVLLQAVGPRGLKFTVENGEVQVGIKDALVGRKAAEPQGQRKPHESRLGLMQLLRPVKAVRKQKLKPMRPAEMLKNLAAALESGQSRHPSTPSEPPHLCTETDR